MYEGVRGCAGVTVCGYAGVRVCGSPAHLARPYLAYISPISRLHLAHISPISRPYLAYISPISRLYLAYISLGAATARDAQGRTPLHYATHGSDRLHGLVYLFTPQPFHTWLGRRSRSQLEFAPPLPLANLRLGLGLGGLGVGLGLG